MPGLFNVKRSVSGGLIFFDSPHFASNGCSLPHQVTGVAHKIVVLQKTPCSKFLPQQGLVSRLNHAFMLRFRKPQTFIEVPHSRLQPLIAKISSEVAVEENMAQPGASIIAIPLNSPK